MKKLKVTIYDQHTLRLEEDGKKGDLIDLKEIVGVDTTPILEKISDATDRVYETELAKFAAAKEKEYQLTLKTEIESYREQVIKLQEQLKTVAEKTKSELELEYTKKITQLESTIEQVKTNKDLEYTNKLNIKKSEMEQLKGQFLLEKEQQTLQHTNVLNEINTTHNEEIRKLEEEIAALKRERSSLSSKGIGEDLETWCDNEYHNQALSSQGNVVWHKDNDTVKGSKADFIYKVYASEAKSDEELLTSVILEMKSEDPTSTNTQQINRFLEKLDRDRNNKNIEYAILVSELGAKGPNPLPIKKVPDFEKMFMVRPEYFLTLLNIITAFGMKYKDILINENIERLKFKDQEEILNEFEEMKAGILDHSVRHINTYVSEILKQSEIISAANKKIQEAVEIVLNRHLQTVINKLNTFQISKITNSINTL